MKTLKATLAVVLLSLSSTHLLAMKGQANRISSDEVPA
jgi:hypothetical protein